MLSFGGIAKISEESLILKFCFLKSGGSFSNFAVISKIWREFPKFGGNVENVGEISKLGEKFLKFGGNAEIWVEILNWGEALKFGWKF